MSLLEILATIVTVACVFLAVKRSTWQYPVGIVGTILFFFVFLNAKLYASAGLQVFFTAVQVYGWWFWLRGYHGKAPPITSWPHYITVSVVLASLGVGLLLAAILNGYTDAKVAGWDSLLFGLSMGAQFLLDRKKLETWIVWGLVNALSVYVYGTQGLTITAWLYAGLFLNAFWGYHEWAKAKRAQKIVWSGEVDKYPAVERPEPKAGDLLP